MNIKKFLLPGLLILLILVLKFSFFQNWFGFDYDQEINAFIAKTIVVDHKPVLIGPETSVGGLYVGPYFNYLIAAFFLLGNMNPMWTIGVNILVTAATLVALFLIAKKIFGSIAAYLSVIIYGFSFELTKYDRVLWNPTPMPLVSLLLLYFLYNYIVTKKTLSLFLATVFVGIAFQLHFTAIFLLGFLFLSLLLFSPKTFINWKKLLIMGGTLLFFFAPLIFFDYRHEYLISNHLISFFLDSKSGVPQMGRTFFENIVILGSFMRAILYWNASQMMDYILLGIILIGTISTLFLVKTSSINTKLILKITFLLFALTLVGFYVYKGPLPSQYALFLLTPFVLVFSGFLSYIFKSGKLGKACVLLFLTAFIVINLPLIIYQSSGLSLKEKTAIIDKISSETKGKKSELLFITAPGLDTGFKYLLWQKDVNYTRNHQELTDQTYKIVVPKELVKKSAIRESFGSIGLIGPEKSTK